MVQTEGVVFGSNSLICEDTGAGQAVTAGSPRVGVSGIHCWDNLNDGAYGNSFSWIPGGSGGKAGVMLPEVRTIVGIQFARDLTGNFADRAGAEVTVEYSATAGSDTSLNLWEGDEGWASAGSVSGWRPTVRNYYRFSAPVQANAVRITASIGGTCIDELDIYASPPPPP